MRGWKRRLLRWAIRRLVPEPDAISITLAFRECAFNVSGHDVQLRPGDTLVLLPRTE